MPFFFFNDTATTEIYTLSLHDALPISRKKPPSGCGSNPSCSIRTSAAFGNWDCCRIPRDRKSTRLNSSHANISYAVFCLKKKKNDDEPNILLESHALDTLLVLAQAGHT